MPPVELVLSLEFTDAFWMRSYPGIDVRFGLLRLISAPLFGSGACFLPMIILGTIVFLVGFVPFRVFIGHWGLLNDMLVY